jgi:lipid II:glycine glycyltransferase (peptidoglycan interpeptide bridge formation enzyme)
MQKEMEVLMSLQRADISICDEARSFLQSGFWGSFKASFGWEALAFRVAWKTGAGGPEEDCVCEKPLLLLRRNLAPGFSLAYVPWGPELPACYTNMEKALRELAASLKKVLPKDTAFIRFDPPWPLDKTFAMQTPFIRSAVDIQAPDTVILDLSGSMESLLEQMKPKWRYNIRLAQKKGINIISCGREKTDIFYNLLKETALRDNISIHSINYYEALFECSRYGGINPDIRLYLAEHENDIIAGIITLFRGREAVYLYGASSNNKRNLMAPYALQFKAMEDARACGCLEYDLFGIPPNTDPSHPMAGLRLFKTGFGGKIIHRPGSWDYPCRFIVYRFFRLAEFLRQNLKRLRKRRRENY